MEDLALMPREFWRGKRVFVTGHTGFKGGWLSLWLCSLGARVHGYALNPPTQPNLFSVARVGEKLAESTIADVRDAVTLRDALCRARPEIVFHLAAQPLVRYSYEQPAETYEVNVMGTVNLLEAVRATPEVRAVVNVTSDKCYENTERELGYREGEPLGGADPYSSSKACAELVTAAYRRSFFDDRNRRVGLASARAGNVLGGGDWAQDRLIPDIIRALSGSRAAVIRNPASTRPWQHVLESVSGYLALAERLHSNGAKFGEAWNFGPSDGDAKPVWWIADQIVKRWGSGRWDATPEAGAVHEARALRLDSAKAHARLGWLPRLSLESALDWTVDWFKAFSAGSDMHWESLMQIETYSSLVSE